MVRSETLHRNVVDSLDRPAESCSSLVASMVTRESVHSAGGRLLRRKSLPVSDRNDTIEV